MNAAETRIVKRMIDEEHLEAVNAENDRTRIKHGFRGDAIKDLASRFQRHNHRVKNAQRERREKTAESKPRNSKPKTNV